MSTKIERYVIRHIAGSKINQVEEFNFSKNQLTIGRAAECDIQFDPEKESIVSRQHGTITRTSTDPLKFTVTDNNSRNGIFVNKTRVKGVVDLQPGDEVQLGLNGPVFSFDIFPRPENLMLATRVVEIPTSIKATAISENQKVTSQLPEVAPAKTGLGKQTVERMLVAERKKSYTNIAVLVGSVIAVLGILGYVFRKDVFGRTTIITNKIEAPVDSVKLRKKSPDQIASENSDRVVQIEFGWQLFDAATSDELWHKYTTVKNADGTFRDVALYIENQAGKIEPYLDIKKNIQVGAPVGLMGASGSGIVVSEDGFILTNRHIGAGWNTRYDFPNDAFPGYLVDANGKIIPNTTVYEQDVFGWVPANTTVVGGNTAYSGVVKGRNTYMNVVFAGTSLRRPVQSSTPSDDHDVALLKVEIPQPLSKVIIKDDSKSVVPGQPITIMGYPGIAPAQFVVRRSQDPFNNDYKFTSVPTPTVTPGNIGRIVSGSTITADKDLKYSTFGDSYQLTVNAGSGSSGGPIFDDEGNVIGLFYAYKVNYGSTVSFAVPIKYGLELMGIRKN